jgi:hypothetical protein
MPKNLPFSVLTRGALSVREERFYNMSGFADTDQFYEAIKAETRWINGMPANFYRCPNIGISTWTLVNKKMQLLGYPDLNSFDPAKAIKVAPIKVRPVKAKRTVRKHKVTKVINRKIARMLKAGASVEEITKETGEHRDQVSRVKYMLKKGTLYKTKRPLAKPVVRKSFFEKLKNMFGWSK